MKIIASEERIHHVVVYYELERILISESFLSTTWPMKIHGTLIVLGGLIALIVMPVSVRGDAQEKKDTAKAKDKEDFIDYEGMLNDKLGKGVTPDKNAVVLIWKALGPTPEGSSGQPSEFFKLLGMEEPPKNGDYYISLIPYLKNRLKLAPEDFNGISDQVEMASKRPWDEKSYPHVASWLKVNEKPLALVIEATYRHEYYSPMVSRDGGKSAGSLIGILLPAAPRCRELADTLTVRAMLNTFAAKSDEAWRDLLACHRLGRQVARGGTTIESLVGIAIDQTAIHVDLAYLEAAGLPSNKILDRLKDLQALPPMPPIVGKIDVTERIVYLQIIQSMRRESGKAMTILGESEKLTEEERKALAMIEFDWDLVVENAKKSYDRVVAAMRLKDRADRQKEIGKIEEELASAVKATKDIGPKDILLSKDGPGKAVAKNISNLLLSLLMPAFRKLSDAQDRSLQNERNLHVAFALAAYKSDRGSYPAKLADLSPRYLAAVPDDLFSGKPLIYKSSEKGYLLYSVGINGKDEDGRGLGDEPPGDDLSIKMPLPPLKK